jgi:hypothetical protein
MPYLGFFHRLIHADEFILLDHVQFVSGTSKSWTHRDKIKTSSGDAWLSLSVKKAPFGTPINAIRLSDTNDWISANLRQLCHNYSRAPFFHQIFPYVEDLYASHHDLLVDFNLESIALIMRLLDIRIPVMLSSSMSPQGSKNSLLIDLLSKRGATHYLSGEGARAYLQTPQFYSAGIQVIWQDFHHPVYPQLFEGFIPYLSTLDLLFNCGIKQSSDILRHIP